MNTGNPGKYGGLFLDIGIFMLGTVLVKTIQFLLMPLYTVYMSVEAYGTAELINGYTELLFPIITLCMNEAAFRFAVDRNFSNSKVLSAMKKTIYVSFVICLTFVFLLNEIRKYEYTFYLLFILYSYSLRMMIAFYVRGKGFSKVFAFSGVVNALVLCVLNIYFIVILGLGTKGYLVSIGISNVISTIYLFLRGNVYAEIDGSKISKEEYEVLLKYCVPLILYNVLYWFVSLSGRYILNYFTDVSTVGIYVATIKISAIINTIQQAIYAAFQLNSARAFDDENKEEYYSNICNGFSELYIVGGAIVILFTPLIAYLTLHNDFGAAKIYLPVVLTASIINCVSSLFGTLYSAYKITSRIVPISLMGAVVNVGISLLLVPEYKIWGICIASVLCYLSQLIYKTIDIVRLKHIRCKWKEIIICFSLMMVEAFLMTTKYRFYFVISIAIVVVIVTFSIKKNKYLLSILFDSSKEKREKND